MHCSLFDVLGRASIYVEYYVTHKLFVQLKHCFPSCNHLQKENLNPSFTRSILFFTLYISMVFYRHFLGRYSKWLYSCVCLCKHCVRKKVIFPRISCKPGENDKPTANYWQLHENCLRDRKMFLRTWKRTKIQTIAVPTEPRLSFVFVEKTTWVWFTMQIFWTVRTPHTNYTNIVLCIRNLTLKCIACHIWNKLSKIY